MNIINTNQNKINKRDYILELAEAKLKVTAKPKGGF